MPERNESGAGSEIDIARMNTVCLMSRLMKQERGSRRRMNCQMMYFIQVFLSLLLKG